MTKMKCRIATAWLIGAMAGVVRLSPCRRSMLSLSRRLKPSRGYHHGGPGSRKADQPNPP